MNKTLKDWRILLLLAAIVISYAAIGPRFGPPGLVISRLEFNSSSSFSGLEPGMEIESINGVTVTDESILYREASAAIPGSFAQVVADGRAFTVVVKEEETEKPLGIEVQQAPSSNIRLGLDLQGGTRALVQPIAPDVGLQNVTEATKEVLSARMNTYGLREVKLRTVQDLEKNWYIQVEMAGAGSGRVLDVIKNVGVFELKIVNETIFTGSEIAAVEASSPMRSGGFGVPFTIKRDAAQDLADAYTRGALANETSCIATADCPQAYTCSETNVCRPLIEMFLDDELKFSAPAAPSLHDNWMSGVLEQDMVVSVGHPDAAKAIEAVMRSGTLPAGIEGIEVISRDFVDPTLGNDFIRSAIFAGIVGLFAVALVVLFRYKNPRISAAIMFTGASEVLLLLGAAALLQQDLDLPSIAGIIAVVGTGVDHQIIITDELFAGKGKGASSFMNLKRAFAIIIPAAATTMATMFPLMTLGVGMVKGFAIMTFLGVLFGVTITRPAFGRLLAYLTE